MLTPTPSARKNSTERCEITCSFIFTFPIITRHEWDSIGRNPLMVVSTRSRAAVNRWWHVWI
jgi:hypothetical protein